MRSPELLSRQLSRLVLIDMQEKLLAAMPRASEITARCLKLIQGANLLGIPVDATEQYPRGLGPTIPILRSQVDQPVEKLRFSAASALSWAGTQAPDLNRPQVVLAGIEAHVCVLQTAYDLQSLGYRIYLAADACGSRYDSDRDWACRRLSDAGVVLTSVEAILFEWCETAQSQEFKQLSRLITGRDPSPGSNNPGS